MTDGPEDNPPAVRDEDALTPVHPNHRTVLRLGMAGMLLPFWVVAGTLELTGRLPDAVPQGIFALPLLLITALLLWRWPNRRYDARGFDMSHDRLRVVRGIWWRSDTVVPFGRVQHIDVTRGPVERVFGLSTLVLHTAGNHNHSVSLPGLLDDDALAMREEIRSHIKREAQ